MSAYSSENPAERKAVIHLARVGVAIVGRRQEKAGAEACLGYIIRQGVCDVTRSGECGCGKPYDVAERRGKRTQKCVVAYSADDSGDCGLAVHEYQAVQSVVGAGGVERVERNGIIYRWCRGLEQLGIFFRRDSDALHTSETKTAFAGWKAEILVGAEGFEPPTLCL